MKKLHAAIDDELLRKAQLLERMTASVRSRLPRNLAEHCWVGGYDSTYLNIITDKAVFRTPIYYQQVEILKQLNEEFGATLKCRFKKVKVQAMREPMPTLEINSRKRV